VPTEKHNSDETSRSMEAAIGATKCDENTFSADRKGKNKWELRVCYGVPKMGGLAKKDAMPVVQIIHIDRTRASSRFSFARVRVRCCRN
jgi:hypothetical protein